MEELLDFQRNILVPDLIAGQKSREFIAANFEKYAIF